MAIPLPLPAGFQRLDPFPLDSTSVFSTYAQLTTYANSYPTSYPGQICAVSGIDIGFIIKSDKTVAPLSQGTGGDYLPLSGGTLTGSLSVQGNVQSNNIAIIEDKINGLYSYLVQNLDRNIVVTSTSISDFVANNWTPSIGLVPGDTITLSAANTVYVLSNSDGSSVDNYFEINLKPNYLFFRTNLPDYGILDTFPLSSMKSAKYVMQVEASDTGDIYYGEVNIVSNGSIAVVTEYGTNHTTNYPFVEFGGSVVNNMVVLSAIPLEGFNMSKFIIKGNRTNFF